jgi:triphosphoribosyl-dephospho-CoA synthase
MLHESMSDPVSNELVAVNAELATLSCVLEATARKPGNVHPEASFAELTYADFVRSAFLIAPSFVGGSEWSVGRIVLDAVERTRRELVRNTNLGILLLLAPLACVPQGIKLREGIGDVLARLGRDEFGREEAKRVYKAIRLARPGGMGHVDREDVADAPTVTLLDAMRMAADRDRVADQYTANFSTVFAGVDRLVNGGRFSVDWEETVIDLHLWLMAEFPDTLIARKCGRELAEESARRARAVLEAGWPGSASGRRLLSDLDRWLRADGHRRNPGTTADLVAACLFAAFRDGILVPPPIPAAARPFVPMDRGR